MPSWQPCARPHRLLEKGYRSARELSTKLRGRPGGARLEHCLAGCTRYVGGRQLIGHGAVLLRRMLCAGRVLQAGYVEGSRSDSHQQHSRGSRHGVEVIAGAYQLGVLGASGRDAVLRIPRWQRWLGRTSVLTPTGVRRTPAEDGYIFVLPVDVRLDHRAELTCDWRPGDVW